MRGTISTHAPRTGSDAAEPQGGSHCAISTHAPRTGSDFAWFQTPERRILFQPTLPARGATACAQGCGRVPDNFNPRSPHGERRLRVWACASDRLISTHAPRTGSDHLRPRHGPHPRHFNPRSPHGERRQCISVCNINNNFNPRSPHGERPAQNLQLIAECLFQPTLPARGATRRAHTFGQCTGQFQPTLPARGAT